jgi:hypothetical protein
MTELYHLIRLLFSIVYTGRVLNCNFHYLVEITKGNLISVKKRLKRVIYMKHPRCSPIQDELELSMLILQ